MHLRGNKCAKRIANNDGWLMATFYTLSEIVGSTIIHAFYANRFRSLKALESREHHGVKSSPSRMFPVIFSFDCI